MHCILEHYLDAIDCAGTVHQLRDAMAMLAGSHGLNSFAYLGLPNISGKKSRLISNYDELWTGHCTAQTYHLCDPVILNAMRRCDPFNWGVDFVRISETTRKFFREAADFGINCGHTIPILNWRGDFDALHQRQDQLRLSRRRILQRQGRWIRK